MALIKINFRSELTILESNTMGSIENPELPTVPATQDTRSPYIATDYTQVDPKEIIAKATGYTDENLWLTWMAHTAREHSVGECIACAKGRPTLVTVPAPLHTNDARGYDCMLNITKGRDQGCETLGSLFPPIHNKTLAAPFTPEKGNSTYVCFNITTDRCGLNHTAGGKHSEILKMGEIDKDWCSEIRNGTELGKWARAGLYYYCGGHNLFVRIPGHSRGLCAMVRLRTPLILIGDALASLSLTRHEKNSALTRRRLRHVLTRAKRSDDFFDITKGSPTYIDAIGVPRGVPDEYKLADQIAAGFENLPLVSALIPITPNKNVDRINYVHYNILRLANLTRDAVSGLAEQLAPTSIVARQKSHGSRHVTS